MGVQTPVKVSSRVERARQYKPGSPAGLIPSLSSLPSMPELNPSAETSRISKQNASSSIGMDRYKNDKLLAVKSMKHLIE